MSMPMSHGHEEMSLRPHIASTESMELVGVPWASVVAAASVAANERNAEELEALASALRLCPRLRCSEPQRIECARVCTMQRFSAGQIVRLSFASMYDREIQFAPEGR